MRGNKKMKRNSKLTKMIIHGLFTNYRQNNGNELLEWSSDSETPEKSFRNHARVNHKLEWNVLKVLTSSLEYLKKFNHQLKWQLAISLLQKSFLLIGDLEDKQHLLLHPPNSLHTLSLYFSHICMWENLSSTFLPLYMHLSDFTSCRSLSYGTRKYWNSSRICIKGS